MVSRGLLRRHYKGNRTVLLRAINALKVNSATEDHSLLAAWNVLAERTNRRVDWLPVDSGVLHFASARWRALLRHPTDPTLIIAASPKFACPRRVNGLIQIASDISLRGAGKLPNPERPLK